MTVIIRNLSEDTKAKIHFGDTVTVIDEGTQIIREVSGDDLTFSVTYERDLRFGNKTGNTTTDLKGIVANKLTEKMLESAGNAILKLRNTYRIGIITDGMTIEVNDCAYFVDTNGFEDHFKCIPGLYYFGEAECDGRQIKVVGSTALNRRDFLRFYKLLFGIVSVRRIFRRAVQNHRQKRISADRCLSKTFVQLYSLSAEERGHQFRPLAVITDKVMNAAKEKISGKMFLLIADHIYKNILPSKNKK